MKNFARSIPDEKMRRERYQTGTEEIFDTAPDRFDDVLRSAHAHEIAWFVRRHVRHQAVEHPGTLFGGLSDREAADGRPARLTRPYIDLST